MTYYNSESSLLVLREEDFTNLQICAITGTTTPIATICFARSSDLEMISHHQVHKTPKIL